MVYNILSILFMWCGTAVSTYQAMSDVEFRTTVMKRLQKLEKNEEVLIKKIQTLEQEVAFKTMKEDILKQEIHSLKREIASMDKVDVQAINQAVSVLGDEFKELQNGISRHERQFVNGYSAPRIAFTAYLNHGVQYSLHPNAPSAIVFNKVLLNDGHAYDNGTGVFTAPVTGVYLFSYSIGAKNISNTNLTQYDIFTDLVVEGIRQLSSVAESTSLYDDEQGSTTMALYTEEGSRVWVRHVQLGGHFIYATENSRITSFTGTLLYTQI